MPWFARSILTESSQITAPNGMSKRASSIQPTVKRLTAPQGSVICAIESSQAWSPLNAHPNSSVHKHKVYHCPSGVRKYGEQFVTLAALFNHQEKRVASRGSRRCGRSGFTGKEVGFSFMTDGMRVMGPYSVVAGHYDILSSVPHRLQIMLRHG